ncbi:hypothetical protein RJ639_015930 [Escallonia herrerae]|uniref:Transposase (putative) gypsy type domain-containing protein n=1 Tax=Escallonia herrerae TaxID=1293975 RepID=A0AA88VCP8_9ASTE|nr:hypothetical protein RJ639_015930 [Escallonia herrerae]
MTVRYVIHNQDKDCNFLQQHLPKLIIDCILAIHIPTSHACPDTIIWPYNDSNCTVDSSECSGTFLFEQNCARPMSILLGQSARTRFCSGRIVFCLEAFCSSRVLGHDSARAESCLANEAFCSGKVLGQDSTLAKSCSFPKLAIENMSELTSMSFEENIVVSSSSSSSSERVPTSGSEIGTLNPQIPQPSTSQPLPHSSSQPSHLLPAKNALRDVKDQAEDKANPKPWYNADEKSSKMSTEDLLELILEYPLPGGWYARLSGLQELANYGTKFEIGIYEEQVKSGYRLPHHPFALCFFEHYHMAPGQLVPNGWRKLAGLIYLVQTSGYKPNATDFMRVFFKICFIKGVANCPGWYYIHSRQRLLKGIRRTKVE